MSYFVLTWGFILNINLRDKYVNCSVRTIWDCHILSLFVLDVNFASLPQFPP